MKKLYLLSLLLPLWSISSAAVQVTSISAAYANQRVTFNISWAAGTRNATHNAKVWVFVDYQPVTGLTPGTWQRATVNLSALPAGCTADGTNTRGFWYQGQATAAQSANITVTLTNVPAKFNWCAYATDYPPNVTATGGTYTLHGTAPFTLIAANGTSTQVVNGTSIAASALTIAPVTIRDATGCPGVFCIYTGADLYIDATHICQQRTSGAQNWEAWIKDVRDNELYRIVLMPDNKWWSAENLRSASYYSICSYTGERMYSRVNAKANCEAMGWRLPSFNELKNIIPDGSLIYRYAPAGYNGVTIPTSDYYGLSLKLNYGNGFDGTCSARFSGDWFIMNDGGGNTPFMYSAESLPPSTAIITWRQDRYDRIAYVRCMKD